METFSGRQQNKQEQINLTVEDPALPMPMPYYELQLLHLHTHIHTESVATPFINACVYTQKQAMAIRFLHNS